jgi:hypothetical protein
MSAPLVGDEEIEGAFRYAPPWARGPQRSRPDDEPPALPDDERTRPPRTPPAPPQSSPRMATGLGGPNIELPKKLREGATFGGDLAMVELRRRLSLQPDVVPEPPIWIRSEPPSRRIMRLSFILLVSFVSAYGLAVLYPGSFDPLASRLATPNIPSAPSDAMEAKAQVVNPARLVIESRRAFANEPLPLGLSLAGASGEEFVLLKGLTAGTRLSAGTALASRGWRVPAREIASVTAFAPKDYVGTMDTAVDLHAGDRRIDSQVLRLEWVKNAPVKSARLRLQPQPPAALPAAAVLTLDPAEVALLIKRGQELLRNGDISAARLMLRRATKAGSAEAAFALGSTFDPAVLAEIGVLGFAPDAEQARVWYKKASELGSSGASQRLERLTSAGGR